VVELDPRIKLSEAALARQQQLETRLADLLDQSSRDLLRAQALLEQLAPLAVKQDALKGPIVAALASVTMLVAGPKAAGPSPPPALGTVNRKIASLYEAVAVDAAPTPAQEREAVIAERELAAVAKQWHAFETSDLPQLQAVLAKAGLPALDLSRRPTGSDADED
jgi:hypothetical protein